MLQGTAQGAQQAQSIMPSVYQPQGKAKPQNPWQGSLDLINLQLLDIAHQVRQQGDAYRDIAIDFQKAANDISKANAKISGLLDEESEE